MEVYTRKQRPREGKGLPMTTWRLRVAFAVILRHPVGSSEEPVLWRPISQEPGIRALKNL